jgi:hypothetical protein
MTYPRGQQINTGGGAAVQGNVHIAGGDFIGRDQHKHYYVQQVTPVFMPRPASRAEQKQPYLAGQPFRVDDSGLFTGRELETDTMLRQIHDPAALTAVVYGPADVGKTSFLSAGILPRLDGNGTDVFPLRDYGDATSLLRALLLGRAVGMGLDVAANAPLPELAKAMIAAASRRMVLILDQFERFFLQDVSKGERDAFRDVLGETIQEVDPSFFQILIAIRDDWQSSLDRQWGDLLPGLRQSPVHLPPLGRAQAQVAITHPAQELGIQPVFDRDFVDKQLLDDLDHLSLEQPGSILPSDLQIVCQYLYETARAKRVQSIKATLYFEVTEGKGAEWILDRHFKGLLDKVEGAQRKRAGEIATEMLAQGSQAWAVPDQLPVEGATPAEIAATLEEMARAELVVWHLAGEQRAYAFASNSIAKAAERALGREAQKRLQARRELESVWQDWVAKNEWASQYQLNLIEDHHAEGPFPVERALVVLRSAVGREMPVQSWLERMNSESARDLIRGLEDVKDASIEGAERLTRQNQAGRVLGLYDEGMPACPLSEAFGPVAWLAAAHKEWQCRETAVLALMTAYDLNALERVEAAVQVSALGGRRGRWRLAELRGMLAEANEEIVEKNRRNQWHERLETWWWRFRRRFSRDRRYILNLTLGAALGSGLGLGGLRYLMAPLLGEERGFLLYSYFPTGFLLGGALALGLVLLPAMGLWPMEHRRQAAGTRRLLPALALGSLFFAGMYVLLMLLLRPAGLFESPLGPPLALMAGAGLSYAVYDQPRADWRIGAGWWLRRLAVVAVVFCLVQTIFVVVDLMLGPQRDLGTALMFTWSGYTYKGGLYDTLDRWGLEGILSMDNWFHVPAVVDAALTGLVLAAGLSVGLIVAGRRYRQWVSLVRRTID